MIDHFRSCKTSKVYTDSFSDPKIEEIKDAAGRDSTYQISLNTVSAGFPSKQFDASDALRSF